MRRLLVEAGVELVGPLNTETIESKQAGTVTGNYAPRLNNIGAAGDIEGGGAPTGSTGYTVPDFLYIVLYDPAVEKLAKAPAAIKPSINIASDCES